jgi:hypothetical protein
MMVMMMLSAPQDTFGDAMQQKELMQKLVKGWDVANFHDVMEATPLENLKLSQIYQR